MKKTSKTKNDLRTEYDFKKLKGGTKGKYARRYSQGVNLVALDPDVAKIFHDSETVNQSLRALLKIWNLRQQIRL